MKNHCKGRILLAEDNEELSMALSALLRQSGYCCTCAATVDDALEALDRRHHDLLLSDIRMPGRDGMALIREVQAKAFGLPVVLLTGFPSVSSAMEAVQLGVVAYLVKPPNFKELFALVETEVERYRAFLAFRESEEQLRATVARLRSEASPSAARVRQTAAASQRRMIRLIQDLEALLDSYRERSAGLPVRRFETERVEAALRGIVSALDSGSLTLPSEELGRLRRQLESVLERN